MKKNGGSESTIIIGPSKSVLVPQLRIRNRPCPISGVRAKIIIIMIEKYRVIQSENEKIKLNKTFQMFRSR